MKKNKGRRPTKRHQQLLPSDPVLKALKLCADAQDNLGKAQRLSAQAVKDRQTMVRRAFAAGATTREIADATQVSRSKIYRLIGSTRAVQA